jgi:integrase
MATRKHKSKATGRVTWSYVFDAPNSTTAARKQIALYGFATRREASEAELKRRVEVQQEYEASLRGTPTPPNTLAVMIEEFCKEHADRNLAPKTVERYREMAAYLAPALLAMPVTEITPLHLTREWNRLRDSGGHHRRTKAARPLSGKTVRNIAGVVSSAFTRCIKWGLAATNPVPNSDLPAIIRKEGIAFTTNQQDFLLQASEIHWALPIILELSAASGARRGEVLALRWSDIVDGRAYFARSLSQTKNVLKFKLPKNNKPRIVTLPESTLEALESHRAKQAIFRAQYGPTYQDHDLIIANPDGTPLRPDSISATVSNLFRRLKLPKGSSLHSLRHTHGSHLLAGGMELTAVSARLGHSSPYVTATIYAHVISGRDDEAAKVWEKYQKRDKEKRLPDRPAN